MTSSYGKKCPDMLRSDHKELRKVNIGGMQANNDTTRTSLIELLNISQHMYTSSCPCTLYLLWPALEGTRKENLPSNI